MNILSLYIWNGVLKLYSYCSCIEKKIIKLSVLKNLYNYISNEIVLRSETFLRFDRLLGLD